MSKKVQVLEVGDFCEIVAGNFERGYSEVGTIGIYEGEFVQDGQVLHVVVSEADPDVFWYVTEVKLFSKQK